jgi:hypothetical protein
MQSTPFRIVTDHARTLVIIEFERVFWDADIAKTFMKACIVAVTSLDCAPGEQLIMVDLREAVLQSQSVFEKMLALMAGATARRIALVASTPLARMQTKRLQIRENVVMFGEMTEAEAWLFGDERMAA